ncbi:uncharacterized protein LOC105710520 [Aotus nancymaae]|uniref:uncharacterized protein LOC105710520 n=1 Tax=Aotus nancymaae TaxID=37293 RepID=UPI0030FE47F0
MPETPGDEEAVTGPLPSQLCRRPRPALDGVFAQRGLGAGSCRRNGGAAALVGFAQRGHWGASQLCAQPAGGGPRSLLRTLIPERGLWGPCPGCRPTGSRLMSKSSVCTACFKAGQFCKKGKREESGSHLWRTPFCQLWGLTPLAREKEGETAPHR